MRLALVIWGSYGGKLINPNTVGLGGGGAMYAPVISPHNQNVMFVACDMSGLYRSIDGGSTWQMLDGRLMDGSVSMRSTKVGLADGFFLGFPVAFHLADPNTIYSYGTRRGLAWSTDLGLSWKGLGLPGAAAYATAVAMDPASPASGKSQRLYVGTPFGVSYSDDNGTTWTPVPGGVAGDVVTFVFVKDPSSPTTAPTYLYFVATTDSVFQFNPATALWTDIGGGLPAYGATSAHGIRGFAGGADGTHVRLYATVPSAWTPASSTFGGGVYAYDFATKTWSSVTTAASGLDVLPNPNPATHQCYLPQYEHLAVRHGSPDTAYLSVCAYRDVAPLNYRLYRTQNGGANWTHVLNVDAALGPKNLTEGWADLDLGPGFGGSGLGVGLWQGATGTSPDTVLFTNLAELYATTDSGTSWVEAYTTQTGALASGQPWRSRGLEVTSTWNYYVSPFNPLVHYICYTDICFALSTDGGQTWRSVRPDSRTLAPGTTARLKYNTFYELGFDPDPTTNTLWAAGSLKHDIPQDTQLQDPDPNPNDRHGGIAKSTDGGVTWTDSSGALPDLPVVSIVIDPQIIPATGLRRLWASLFGDGVWRSEDSGNTWTKTSTGLGSPTSTPPQLNTYRLYFVRDGTPNGKLFCAITGKWKAISGKEYFFEKGGLWRSDDLGTSWTCVTTHPVLLQASYHVIDFAVHPTNTNAIYLCASGTPTIPPDPTIGFAGQAYFSGGLFRTTDGGLTWAQMGISYPTPYDPDYLRCFAPTFDPNDPDHVVYVTTTVSGVWRTTDAGATWSEFVAIPFMSPTRITFTRQWWPWWCWVKWWRWPWWWWPWWPWWWLRCWLERDVLYITTFGGGVWRVQLPWSIWDCLWLIWPWNWWTLRLRPWPIRPWPWPPGPQARSGRVAQRVSTSGSLRRTISVVLILGAGVMLLRRLARQLRRDARKR
jgi:hypothetical protein